MTHREAMERAWSARCPRTATAIGDKEEGHGNVAQAQDPQVALAQVKSLRSM